MVWLPEFEYTYLTEKEQGILPNIISFNNIHSNLWGRQCHAAVEGEMGWQSAATVGPALLSVPSLRLQWTFCF